MANDVNIKFGVSGDQQFKSALSGIDSQIKNLNSEMKLAVSEMAGMEESEKDNSKQLEIYQKTIDATKNKITILSTEYDKQKSKLDELAQKIDEAKNSQNANSEEIKKAEDAYNRQAKVVNDLGTKLNNTKANLNDSANAMSNLSNEADNSKESLEEAGKSASIFGEVLSAEVASELLINGIKKLTDGLKELATASAGYADDILTQSIVTGLSTDTLQEYKYMADLVDVSLETITGSQRKLINSMLSAKNGSKEATIAFEELGVSVLDSDGNLRDSREVFNEVIDSLATFENETERDAYAMKVFGKSAQDLNPLIAAGSERLNELAQEAHDVGYVMSEDALNSNGAFQDSLDRMKSSTEALKNTIGTAFAPALESLATIINDLVNKFTVLIQEHEWLGPVIVGLTTAFTALGVAMGISATIDLVKKSMAALNVVLSANPIGIVIALIAGLVAAFIAAYQESETFREIINNAFESVKNFITNAIEKVKEAVNTLKELPKQALEWGRDLLENFISGIKEKIEKLKSTVRSVANTVKDFIGFSEPSKGPLSNFHTFAPDMMDLFESGILAGIPKIESAISKIAAVTAAGAVASNSINISMSNNFSGQYSPAMADSIAEDLINRIDRQLGRRY